MSVLPILRWPDPRLAQAAAKVPEGAVPDGMIGDLFDTLYAAGGRGLAAPQVGAMQRLFVMDAGWKTGTPTPRACLDPVILMASEARVTGPEACLSAPDVTAEVPRHARITLAYTDDKGRPRTVDLDGFEAVCAQHEIDHLDGIMHFDRIGRDARAALLATYEAAQ